MKHIITSIKNSFAPANDRRMSRSNRRAIAELKGLSDSQLKDIGIDRGSIKHSVLYGKPNTDTQKTAA